MFLFTDYGVVCEPSAEFGDHFPQCKLYSILNIQLDQAVMVARYNKDTRLKRTVYGMVYSHAVTLLETFIGNSLIALAGFHLTVLLGVAQYYDEINKNGIMTMSEVMALPNGMKGKITSLLQNDTFHNPDTIVKMFHKAFGEYGKGIDTSQVQPIIARRHDIIHRNGVSSSGERLMLELEILEEDIKVIRGFSADLLAKINSAISHL